MNILQNNPYRILGVYSNSPTKERLANYNRMKAFLKVGKPVSFPLDLPQYLSGINRTESIVADAEAKLTLPKDQIYYSQFWFVKVTPLDDVAFKNLLSGEIDKAQEIWQKKECASSLQNLIVCSLMRSEYGHAILCAETLYANTQYVGQLVSAVIGTGGNVDAASLAFSFLDVLCDEIGASELLPLVTDASWKKHIEEKTVQPLIDSISDAIEVAHKSKGEGPNTRLNAGEALMKETRTAILQLKKFLSPTDLQYQMIADKLGLEILQCGIDYYNDSDEPNAALKAMPLQKYAKEIVVGQMAKDRCDENVRILEGIISKLPPMEVMANHRAIQAYLSAFAIKPDLISCSIQLIKDCAPHIVNIKEKLGSTHQYYLKISTTIINNALGNIIAEVNEAQNSDFNTLKRTLISAWRAQLYMDKFDLEPEYKEGRYKECREALHGIISNCKGFDHSGLSFMYQYGCGWCNDLDTSDVDLRTDEEYYQSCRNLTSYRSYLQRFPLGKYATQAKSKIEKLRFKQCKTIADYQKFISDYPNSKFIAKAKDELNRLKKEEERKERAISSCSTTDEIVSLYNREKSNSINIDKCSLRAFELAKCEEDYRKVLSIFGVRTSGGEKAQTCLDEIEKKRKEAAERRSKTIKWSLIIVIPLLVLLGVYLIWGLSSTCYVLTFIFGFIALVGIGSKEGCLIGLFSGLIASLLGCLGSYLGDLSNEENNQKAEYVSSSTNESKKDY